MTDTISPCRCVCFECVLRQSSKHEKTKNYRKADQIINETIEYMKNTINRLQVAQQDLRTRTNFHSVKLDSTQIYDKENWHKTSEVCQSKVKGSKKGKVPVAVFDELDDPNKKPMYPKQLVYANGQDIQLEELRAQAYWKKVENEKESCIVDAPTGVKISTENEPVMNHNCSKAVQATVTLIETGTQTDSHSTPVASICTQTEALNFTSAIETCTQTDSQKAPVKETYVQTTMHLLPLADISTQTESQGTFTVKIDDVEVKRTRVESLVTDVTKNDDTLTPVDNLIELKSELICDTASKPADIKPKKKVSETFVISCKDDCESARGSETKNASLTSCISSEIEFEDTLTECDTKAFRVVPSSTPFHYKNRKHSGNETFDKEHSDNETFTHTKPAANLSMILELSKERYSQSTQSTSSGKNSAVGVGSKTVVLSKRESTPRENSESESRADNCINLEKVKNPFDGNLIDYFLKRAKLGAHLPGYVSINSDIPSIRPPSSIKLGLERYNVIGEIGKGAYARILKIHPENNPSEIMALKHQKPACVWEWYISREIRYRLNDKEKEQFFIHYSKVYVFKNGSLMLSDWARCGTILSLMSSLKNVKNISDRCPMSVCANFSMQLITAIHYLHSCQIIHGDVKPDNFVLVPCSSSPMLLVKLIDFGRSIDMKLFPPNKVFNYVVTTEDFTCNEMKEGKPWSYQIDLFGLAATIYVILMGDYMKVEKKSGIWMPKRSISRYLNPEVWSPILQTLLNVPSSFDLPDLMLLKKRLEEFQSKFNKFTLNQQMTSVLNVVYKK